MSRLKRKFNFELKLQILLEAEQHGVEVTLRKRELSRNLYYNWENSLIDKVVIF